MEIESATDMNGDWTGDESVSHQVIKVDNTNHEEKEVTVKMIKGISSFSERLEEILLRLIHDQEDILEKITSERQAREAQVRQLEADFTHKTNDLEKGLSDLSDKLDKEQSAITDQLEQLSQELKNEDSKLKEDLEGKIQGLQQQLQDNKDEMTANQGVLIDKLDSINGELETAIDQLNGKLNNDVQEMKDILEDKNNALNDAILEEKSHRELADEDLNKRLSDLKGEMDDINQDSSDKLGELEASLNKKIDVEIGEVKSDLSILGSKLDFGLSGVDKKMEDFGGKFELALLEERDLNTGKTNELKMALEEEKLLRVQDIEIAKNNLIEKMQAERLAMEDKNAEVIKMVEEDREELEHLGKKIDAEKRDRGKMISDLKYKIEEDLSKSENKTNAELEALKESFDKESTQNKAENKKIHSDIDELHDLLQNEFKECNSSIKDLLKEEEASRIKNDEEIRATLEEYNNRLDGSDSDRDAGLQAIRDELAEANQTLQDNVNTELASLKETIQSEGDALKDSLGSLKDDINTRMDGILSDVENEKTEREKSGSQLGHAIEDMVNSCISDIKSLGEELEANTTKFDTELANAKDFLSSELAEVKDLIEKEGEERSAGLQELKSNVDQNKSDLDSDMTILKGQMEANKAETADFVDSAMAKVTEELSSIDSLLRNDLENLGNLVKEVKAETLDTLTKKVEENIQNLDEKLSGKMEADIGALDESVNQKLDAVNAELANIKGNIHDDNSSHSSQLNVLKAELEEQQNGILQKMTAMDEELNSELTGKMIELGSELNMKIDSVQCTLDNGSKDGIQQLSDDFNRREAAMKDLLNEKSDKTALEAEIGVLRKDIDQSADQFVKDMEHVNEELSAKLLDLDKKLDDEEKCIKDTIQAMNSDLISKMTDDFDTLNQNLEKERVDRENMANEFQNNHSSDMGEADKLRLEIQGMKEVIYDNKLKGSTELDNLKNLMLQDKAEVETRLSTDSQSMNQKMDKDLNKMHDLLQSLEEDKKRLEKELSKVNEGLQNKLTEGSKELEDLIHSENKNISDRLEAERKLLEEQFRQKNKELTNWLKDERERSESSSNELAEQLSDEKAKQAKLAGDNQGLLEGLESMKREIGSRQKEIDALRDELSHEKAELLKSNLKLSDLLNNETKLRQEQMDLQEEKAREISGLLQRQGHDDDIRYKTLKEDLFKLRQEVVLPLSVCFNASRSIPYTRGGEEYLTFSSCSLNYGGAFDLGSGIFKAPIDGIYLIALHVCTHDLKKVLVSIRRNGTELATLYDQNHVDNHKNSMAGQSILAELNAGDNVQVYLYTFTGLHDKEGNHLTQFMGMLMKPIENLVVSQEYKKSEPIYAVPDNRRRVIMSQEPA